MRRAKGLAALLGGPPRRGLIVCLAAVIMLTCRSGPVAETTGATVEDRPTPAFSALILSSYQGNENVRVLALPSLRVTRLGIQTATFLSQDAAADRFIDSAGHDVSWGWVAAFPSGRHLTAKWPWGEGDWAASLSPDGSRVAYRRPDGSVVVMDVRPWRTVAVLRFGGYRLLPRAPHGPQPTGDEPWQVDALAWVGREALWALTSHDTRERGRLVSISGNPRELCRVRADRYSWCIGRGRRIVALATRRTAEQERRLRQEGPGKGWQQEARETPWQQDVTIIEGRGEDWTARHLVRVKGPCGAGNICDVALAGDLVLVARDVSGAPLGYYGRHLTGTVKTRVDAIDLRTGRRLWSATYGWMIEFLRADVGHGISLWEVSHNELRGDLWCVRVTRSGPRVLKKLHTIEPAADDMAQ